MGRVEEDLFLENVSLRIKSSSGVKVFLEPISFLKLNAPCQHQPA
jgi:hypothetical protein